MGFLTELAKSALVDYVETKGVEGIAGDVKSIGNGLNSFFSNDNASNVSEEEDLQAAQQLWCDLIDEIKSNVENGNFSSAENILWEYYDSYEDEKDFYFYYWHAYIQLSHVEAMSYKNNLYKSTLDAAYSSIRQAEKKDISDDMVSDIQSLKDTYDAQELLHKYEELNDEVADLVEKQSYNEALEIIETFFEEENCGHFNFTYYFLKIGVYLSNLEEIDDFDLFNKHKPDIDALITKVDESIYNSSSRQEAQNIKKRYNVVLNKYARRSNASQQTEKEYIEEYKACLADDGSVSDKERRLLDRLAKSLGLSPEKVNELETSVSSPSLTDDEKEYLDEYKACLADDGSISDKERRLLDRLAKSLGLSQKRMKEIEDTAN